MKNFRKVLALILVVATLFSFVAMASAKSASEYTDYADVQYVEAVDVLTALGIINGYDGAYHPADTIDRDEMAKMIAVLRNAGDFDADLYAAANKFADVKGQWAEGYVAYCAQLGIIAGYNATTFAPDAAVKVIEVAKMLLCTLGFDAQKQGYVGANWEVAVLRDATKYGLIPADVNPYEAATRDQAAQMFLNALQCDMVAGYVSENIVTVTNSLYAGKGADGDYHFTNISLKEAEKAGWEIAYGNAVVSTTPLYSIYAKLEKVPGQFDCYGRPGHKWVLKGAVKDTVIGFYADAATATWTAADADTINATLTKYTDKSVAVYVDGEVYTTGKIWNGNGVLVEYYAAANRVVCVNTYIAKVASVSERYGTFKLTDAAGTADLGTYKTGDYAVKAGDVVLYWLCNDNKTVHAQNAKLHDLKVIEAVNVDVTASDIYTKGMDTVLYASGKEYKYAANLGNNLNGQLRELRAADISVKGDNYNLYLDEYGYIMYYAVPAPADTTTYAYYVEGSGHCLPNGQNVGAIGGWKDADCINTATLVHYAEDGALTPEKKFAVDHDLLEAADVRADWDITASDKGLGMLFRYTVDANGNMVYDNTDLDDQAKYAPVGAKLSEDSWVINADAGIYCYSGTKFMIRTLGLDGQYTYEQVTGYENLTGTYISENVEFGYYRADATNIQYFTDPEVGNDKFATYVFIDAKYTDAAAKHFMVLGTFDYERFETVLDAVYGDEYYVYDAIVDGKRALIASDETVAYGKMYDSILSYINFDVTLADGTVLELYCESKEARTKEIDVIDFDFVVDADNEVYISVDGKVYKLAEGFVAYTIGAVKNADGKLVLDIYESYVTSDELAAGGEKILSGYLFTDGKTPASATELYIIASDFLKLF